MDEEPLESPVSLQDDMGPIGKAGNWSATPPSHRSTMHPGSPLPKGNLSPRPEGKMQAEVKEEEPPVDWFEPLEDDEEDDAHSFLGRNDAEEESLAGESERSESVAGSEKAFKKINQVRAPRRKRSHPDEGWEDWPALGAGWKRKEVVRRSGSSIGQKDVYYMGPRGDRVRSRVELVAVLEGVMDLSNYDYKSGQFCDGTRPIRTRRKRKVRERSSSESSYMERGEGADTPDSYHRLTPVPTPKTTPSHSVGPLSQSTVNTPKFTRYDDQRESDRIKLPMPSSSKRLPLPSINGAIGSEDSILICARCGISFTGTWYDRQRKRPCCPSCWASKTREHPMIRFRKWIPCGQCVGCHNTSNCGQCANCKHNVESPESRKRICRKRKCICPIRKGTGSTNILLQSMYKDVPENYDDTSFQNEFADSQNASLKNSDTENIANMDMDDDDDDLSTDDDDDWHKKRKRRACGECKACLSRKDCGTCDFCIDKPKFGGSNKKRQKCRQRQCQRQAMRHLLPFQMGQGDFGQEGPMVPGRPRPHYTYSRKSTYKKSKGAHDDYDFSDNGDDDDDPAPLSYSESGQRNGLYDRHSHISHHNYSQDPLSRDDGALSVKDGQRRYDDDDDDDDDDDYDDEEEEMPMITQIYSLADYPAPSGTIEGEGALMKLLHSLRTSALPILWYAIMVEGPQLQLIQCSKQSSMTDTMVLIDPGFFYQVTVQKQPLFPTHPLYDNFPARLTSTTEVVNLLLGLEKYSVCQGLPPREEPLPKTEPIVLERASTCDFLVNKNVSICNNCKALERI